MAEHKREPGSEQEDPFADMVPERRISEQTARIVALATFITSAKERGNSWASISARLRDKLDIHITANHLRIVMERYTNYKPHSTKHTKPNTKNVVVTNKRSRGLAAAKTAKANTEQSDDDPKPANPQKPPPFGARGFEL